MHMLKKYLIDCYNHFYDVQRKFRLQCRYRFRVLSPEATVKKIKREKCSMVRYGDGEFGLITKTNNPDFQQNDAGLARRLEEICASRDPRVLVCIPHNFKPTKDCNEFARKFWEWWIWENDNLRHVAELLHLNPWKSKVFGDAQITRPYMDWKDKQNAGKRFDALKSLWQGEDILIVEGSGTKLGVGNDLFGAVNSIQRVICPSKNAFSSYDEILQAAIEYGKDKMVLIALGPTATVLAYDLAMHGIQALDIGHIDIEYEWFRMGATEKVPVVGKEVQEVQQDSGDGTIEDTEYLSQIVKHME